MEIKLYKQQRYNGYQSFSMNKLLPANQVFLDNLQYLKQLWTSNANEETLKQVMWTFKRKLPIQFQRSILSFCSPQKNYSSNVCSLSIAAQIFKSLDCANNVQIKIKQFQNLLNKQTDLNDQQISIILYNLSCLYEKANMNTKAEKHIISNLNMNKLNLTLKAKIILKSQNKKTFLIFTDKSEQAKIIQRFNKFKNVQQNIDWVNSLNQCTLNQLFNIGLSLKKNNKYKQSMLFFEKVQNQLSNVSYVSTLAKINIAECNFSLGFYEQAIKILTNLISSQNFHIRPYLTEINSKIFIWSRSNQILGLACLYGNKLSKEIKDIISLKQIEQPKNLLKNTKLLFLNQKNIELNKILNVSSKKTKISLFSHKTSRSLLPYKNTNQFKKQRQKAKNNGIKQTKQQTLKIPNVHALTKPKTKARKISQFQSLNQFLLNTNINSALASHNSTSSLRNSQSNRWADQNLVDHYWTIIKNSKDSTQIAENYLNLGDVYSKQNDHENALNMYKQALQKGRYEAYGRIGNIYYSKGKSNAIQYFQKYLKSVDENDHEIRLKLLHCYSKNPQCLKRASQQLKQILMQNPYDKEAHILYATVLMKQKYYDKAIQQCQKFKQTNFMCFQNHHLLGLLYKSINKTKQAFNCFISSLRINTNSIISLIELTQLTDISSFLPELITLYRKTLNSNTKNHQTIQILKNLISKNVISFESIKPSLNFSELITIGDFFMEKQMIQQAQYSYKLAGDYTNNTLLKQKLGNLEYFKKNYAEAEIYYKESQKRKPVFKIQVKLGHAMLKQNKFRQAQAIFEDCIAKQNENKSIYLNMLGQCEFGLENYQKALNKFEQSSKLGYNKKVNFYWENACRKKIMQKMVKQKQKDTKHNQ